MTKFHALRFILLPLTACLVGARLPTQKSQSAQLKAVQVSQESAKKAHISPELEPTSSTKFFNKDYPFDKRPNADALHFKHPYPAVQDSGDFDRDYVKDENSDNGYWKAQETYDKLRATLRKENRDLAKAKQKKDQEEAHVREVQQQHEKERRDKEEAAAKAKRIRQQQQEARRKRQEARAKNGQKDDDNDGIIPGIDIDGDDDDSEATKQKIAKEVEVSTAETEKAMRHLEDCKKQLAEARQQLKDMMTDLEKAKQEHAEALKKLEAAEKTEASQKEHHDALKKKMGNEYQEYLDAKKEYERQKAIVEKLEADLKVAEAKVRAIRDAEDRNGGVYPERGRSRSGAPALQWLQGLAAALTVLAASW